MIGAGVLAFSAEAAEGRIPVTDEQADAAARSAHRNRRTLRLSSRQSEKPVSMPSPIGSTEKAICRSRPHPQERSTAISWLGDRGGPEKGHSSYDIAEAQRELQAGRSEIAALAFGTGALPRNAPAADVVAAFAPPAPRRLKGRSSLHAHLQRKGRARRPPRTCAHSG